MVRIGMFSSTFLNQTYFLRDSTSKDCRNIFVLNYFQDLFYFLCISWIVEDLLMVHSIVCSCLSDLTNNMLSELETLFSDFKGRGTGTHRFLLDFWKATISIQSFSPPIRGRRNLTTVCPRQKHLNLYYHVFWY